MFKKGQAAMEFLMTYGWAILVVLAAIGALAYFGVLSPDNLLPERTSFQAPIPNLDNAYMTTSETIEIPFSNNVGYTISVMTANAAINNLEIGGSSTSCSTVNASINSGAASSVAVNNNKNFKFQWQCNNVTFNKNDRIKGDFTFQYNNTYTNQVRLHTGTINGKVS